MDRLFALLALAALIGFLGVIASFVPETDLLIVFGLVIVLAVYDFWDTLGSGTGRGDRGRGN